MRYGLRIGVLAAVFAGCAGEPLGYEYMDRYSLSILQGSESGVYFLPPLLHSVYDGTFAPDREPVVVICAGAPASPCSTPVAEYDMVLDAGEDEWAVVRMILESERYMVNWNTAGVAHGLYRIFVTEAGAPHAFIDVVLSKGGTSSVTSRRIRAYGADQPREFNGTLPIAFRLEEHEVVEPANGLTAQYYDWSNSALDYAEAALILERIDPVVDFVDPDGGVDVLDIGQTDHVLARWTGFVVAEADEFYTLCVTARDGVRLFVNNFLFIDQWSDRDVTRSCASLFMEAGSSYPIRLEWYNSTGNVAVSLSWQTTPDNAQVIPASSLLPN
jgi:hypothetical protein